VGDNAFEVRIFSIASENVRFDLVLPGFISSVTRVDLAGELIGTVGLEGARLSVAMDGARLSVAMDDDVRLPDAMEGARLSVEIEPGQIETFRFQCG
jgi:hypothetical protein